MKTTELGERENLSLGHKKTAIKTKLKHLKTSCSSVYHSCELRDIGRIVIRNSALKRRGKQCETETRKSRKEFSLKFSKYVHSIMGAKTSSRLSTSFHRKFSNERVNYSIFAVLILHFLPRSPRNTEILLFLLFHFEWMRNFRHP